ncbi:MAG TPA: amidohydrolase family protein [Methylomirabilota bacterium]|jgi:cytosine deaminase|nr:amidohydrolase family protein [Methylomirabilota bacterium]
MTAPLDLLLRECRLPDGRVTDIGCRDGRIALLGSLAGRPAAREIAGEGRVVTPGLVDAHIHLDKALLSDRAPSREGSLAEALRVTAEAKRGFTRDDILARARRTLDMAVRQGTTAMRSHAEIDPIVGLMGFEALATLKREYAPAIDLQLCAFAQEGILKSPGTEALLREALRAGADLVGGVPYVDPDPRRHVDIVFDLAAEFGVDADFHADFFDEPQHLHARYIAAETVRRGWQGRVALGHMSEMAALPPDEQDALARELAGAGVAVIVLPATDLYLMGRKDVRSPRRGLAPVKRLLAAGVTVAAATNNVQNAFTPVGTAGLPLMGFLLSVGAHMGTDAELGQVLELLTTQPARILRISDYGLGVGSRADLVVWEAERAEQVVSAQRPCRLIVKAGRVTVEHARSVREPWRAAP